MPREQIVEPALRMADRDRGQGFPQAGSGVQSRHQVDLVEDRIFLVRFSSSSPLAIDPQLRGGDKVDDDAKSEG